MSGVYNVLGQNQKHEVMADTWGHLYPEPGSKHRGTMLITEGEYGDCTIIRSEFTSLCSSPQRYQLEHTIFDYFDMTPGEVLEVNCTLWFFKSSDDMYLGERIGKIVKIEARVIA